ncbi:hypothetical protein A7985_23090 [Pseudoalteromonas luteoviolacea]|uniref:histidine kinase n=1 Tax=Pseudoalteromonas luteoviolacea TaxID=43657 RepID=A0A1C0TJM6_9GAMM|nr:ATP-binding protein [Pseudoalteromonas luteoviolacea]MBQ4813911.1 GHKL domain-containing protein [Pseudoalteromonas luteoviolacea]OCQ18773.1 hypothetical protein A7985_23090 [Pseudoalteromonas luteoviolacea]
MKANLERGLQLYMLMLNSFIGLLICVCVNHFYLSIYSAVAVGLGIFTVLQAFALRLNKRVIGVFKRANIQLEAMQQSDFNHQLKPHFLSGEVAEFEHRLVALSEQLHRDKAKYNRQLFVVYQLIDKLSSPIWIFDDNDELSYANPAFELIYHVPWQSAKGRTIEQLDLENQHGEWRFKHDSLRQNWTLHSSEFFEAGQRHRLVIATDVRKALRHQELAAWQRLLRVIGHEIHNSLSPVSSLAQSLRSKVAQPRDQNALTVIEQRSAHLQQFVARYNQIARPLDLRREKVVLNDLLMSIKKLFSEMYDDQHIDLECSVRFCSCDPQLLEQVLINLLKNAFEANLTQQPPGKYVQLSANYQARHVVISIADQGGGFANLDNAMTPFYSTKSDGQGIGITLSRQIIEQHGGSLTVSNGLHGAEIKIALPN